MATGYVSQLIGYENIPNEEVTNTIPVATKTCEDVEDLPSDWAKIPIDDTVLIQEALEAPIDWKREAYLAFRVRIQLEEAVWSYMKLSYRDKEWKRQIERYDESHTSKANMFKCTTKVLNSFDESLRNKIALYCTVCDTVYQNLDRPYFKDEFVKVHEKLKVKFSGNKFSDEYEEEIRRRMELETNALFEVASAAEHHRILMSVQRNEMTNELEPKKEYKVINTPWIQKDVEEFCRRSNEKYKLHVEGMRDRRRSTDSGSDKSIDSNDSNHEHVSNSTEVSILESSTEDDSGKDLSIETSDNAKRESVIHDMPKAFEIMTLRDQVEIELYEKLKLNTEDDEWISELTRDEYSKIALPANASSKNTKYLAAMKEYVYYYDRWYTIATLLHNWRILLHSEDKIMVLHKNVTWNHRREEWETSMD
jgi:hypothetical protein